MGLHLHRTSLIIALWAVSAPLLASQDIRGLVLEQGPNTPIAEVEISIRKVNRIVGQPSMGETFASQKTDAAGKFLFKNVSPGEYTLTASRPGYAGTDTPWFASDPATLNVALAGPEALDVRFPLIRRGTVTGTLIDSDSGDPISGLDISVVPVGYNAGKRAWLYTGGRSVTTDAKGKFSFGELLLGDYAVVTNPRALFKAQVASAPLTTDAPRRFTYPTQFLPGAGNIDNIIPVSVVSGITLDVGALRLKKVPALSAKLSITCDTDKVELLIGTDLGHQMSDAPKGPVECGKPFWLTGLPPDTYRIAAFSRPFDTSTQASAELTLRDKDEELSLPLQHGIDLDGRILLPKNSTPVPLSGMRLVFQRRDGPFLGAPDSVITSTDKGTFLRPNVPQGSYIVVAVNGLPNGYYAKTILLNNVALPGRTFQWTGDGTLDVEIDDSPSSIQGKVTNDKGQPVSAQVVLGFAPFGPDGAPSQTRKVIADGQGTFTIRDLAPGNYRLFAVALEDRQTMESPAIFPALWANAEKLQLDRGEASTIALTQRSAH